MKEAPIPDNEQQRLDALGRYNILDTLPEQAYDDLTALASHICGTPIALISIIDRDRQWFKSSVGLDASETPRDISFCGHVVANREMLVVPNAAEDPRFADNPLVADDPSIRFYAGAPLVTPDDQYLGTLCVIDSQPHDMTQPQLEMLQALARQVGRLLELRLGLQRLQSSEQKLMVAVDAERSANQAKSIFLANMSHELRTPMNAIIGYCEMLQEEAAEEEREDLVPDLQRIHQAGKQLLGLINDILDLSKIEAGRMELVPEIFDIAHLVNEVAMTVQPLIDQNANTLHIRCEPELGTMHSDSTRVRQILFNLLSNAAKFTQKGNIDLCVAKQTLDGKAGIRFVVKDNGIGMSEEQLKKIFQAFTQADDSTSRKYGGTGLGLAICREFCQMMGGDIVAESSLGNGSTFTVRILAASDPS